MPSRGEASIATGLDAQPDDDAGLRTIPLFAQVAELLRRRIVAGIYTQGTRLVEGRLSAELGVSRVPVREALHALATEGLVELSPRRSASVTRVPDAIGRELVEVRATLEGLNARLAAQRRDPALGARLEAVQREGRLAAADGRTEALLRLNASFHELLASTAANSVLREMVRSLRERTFLMFAPVDAARARQNWEEHARILQAVIDGDADLAALLASRHVYSAHAAMSRRGAGAGGAAPG
ncbi:GntR family transcriptional regulator [Cupriavidus malaysiensis]|uniref:GntR family transcriptional regulator n=1 Tax=Cupriavidus malaysiensis TaxID=367825 RepID=UPI000A06C7C2|nr:GntR family transcriptional regulator [Cupriavidus malaysiensis]